MALEEMLVCDIPYAYIFYEKERRREKTELSDELRDKVAAMATEMQDYAKRVHTPRVKPHSGCKSCSLRDLCLPQLQRFPRVRDYLNACLEDDE